MCTAGRNIGARGGPREDGQLLLTRYRRSIEIALHDGPPVTITKTPSCTAYAAATAQENEVLDVLTAADHRITATLSSGTVESSPFGSARIETPPDGTPLDGSPEAFRDALELGFGWPTAFQRAFRDDDVTLSPSEVRVDLWCDHPAVGPPPDVTSAIESFVSPIHGDYAPDNVFIDDGSVSCVLDWEFATLEENPCTDVGALVFNLY